MKRSVEPASAAILYRVVGAVMTFGLVYRTGSELGAAAGGAVLFAWASAQFIANICRLGTFGVLLRTTSQAHTTLDQAAIRGAVRQISAICCSAGALAAAALSLAPAAPLELFDSGSISANFIRLFAWTIPLQTLSLVAVEALKGVDKSGLASLVQTGLANGIILILLVVLKPANAEQAAVLFAVGTTIATVMSLFPLARLVFRGPSQAIPMREVVRSAAPLLAFDAARVAALWAPAAVLAWRASNAEVGIFSTATRFSAAASLSAVALSNHYAPRYARLHMLNQRAELARCARSAAHEFLKTGIPLAVLAVAASLFVFPSMGPSFDDAVLVLTVLVVSELIRGTLLPATDVLVMSARESAVTLSALVASTSATASALALVPRLGATGAAIAALLAASLQGGLNTYLAALRSPGNVMVTSGSTANDT